MDDSKYPYSDLVAIISRREEGLLTLGSTQAFHHMVEHLRRMTNRFSAYINSGTDLEN